MRKVVRGRPRHATVVAYLALFVALGGTTWAAAKIGSNDIKRNAVKSKHIKNKEVKRKDVALDAIGTAQVANDELTGDDVLESSLGGLLSSSVYKQESAIGAGTALGDGTFIIDQACLAGDQLLSGGPANVNAASDMVESFPTPGSTNSWRGRIDKNAAADNFSVVAFCADQP